MVLSIQAICWCCHTVISQCHFRFSIARTISSEFLQSIGDGLHGTIKGIVNDTKYNANAFHWRMISSIHRIWVFLFGCLAVHPYIGTLREIFEKEPNIIYVLQQDSNNGIRSSSQYYDKFSSMNMIPFDIINLAHLCGNTIEWTTIEK